MTNITKTITCLFCLLFSLAASADSKPWEELEALFPDEMALGMQKVNNKWGVYLERVKMTKRSNKDDAKLAWALYDNALGLEPTAEAAGLCQIAYELGSKTRSGYPAAIRSMELMASRHHSMRFFFFHKAAVLMEKWYRIENGERKRLIGREVVKAHEAVADDRFLVSDDVNATLYYRRAAVVAKAVNSDRKDEIHEKLQDADLRLRTELQIKKELARLKENNLDIIARRKIIDQYITGMDDPYSAAEYLDGFGVKADKKKMVSLAMQEIEFLPPSACMSLGKWYEGLSKTVEHPRAAQNMRIRAADYYERYLKLNNKPGSERNQILLALTTIAPDRAKEVKTPLAKPPVIKKPEPPVVAQAEPDTPDKPDTPTTDNKPSTGKSPPTKETPKTYTRRRSLRKDWSELKEKKDEKSRPSFFDIPLE